MKQKYNSKKKVFWALVIISSLFVSTLGNAEVIDYKYCDGFKYTDIDVEEGYVKIVGYKGDKKKVTIPKKLDGIPVKLMKGFGEIEKLHIPANIEVALINKAKKLKKITVAKSHKKYTAVKNVLYNKKKTQVLACTRTNKNPSILKSVKKLGGLSYTNITSFTVPEKVKTIEDAAFYKCKKLKSIDLNDKLKSIDGEAFVDCKSLQQIKIPNSVTYLSENAFSGCSKLSSIKLSESLTALDEGYWFSGCKALKEVRLPKSIKRIDEYALSDNNGIERVYVYNKKCVLFYSKPFDTYSIHKGITIHGYKGSTAEEYAKKNGNKFVVIG